MTTGELDLSKIIGDHQRAVLDDLDEVNARLGAIDERLVIADRAQMYQVDVLDDIVLTNNYMFYISTFGEVIDIPEDPYADITRRPPTDNERSEYLTLALDGGHDRMAFYEMAELVGMSREAAMSHWQHGFFRHRANVRAFLLFQPMMEGILAACLNNGQISNSNVCQKEIFTAYQLSSRLADVSDRSVRRQDGSFDDYALCR